jgi:hypothetical protein
LVEKVLGWTLDPEKEQVPSQSITFLGVVEDYFPSDETGNRLVDCVVLRPKEGRVEEILKSIKSHKEQRRLSSGEAKTLRGRIINYANTCAGRVGKGILHYVNERAAEVSPLWSEDLSFNLDFLQIILELKIHRAVSIVRGPRRGLRMWTDASFSFDDQGVPRCQLCAIVQPKELGSKPVGIVIYVPPRIIGLFDERKQQIHMGELLAPMCAVLAWPSFLLETSAIAYIDNMGVLCNIVNGSSRACDAGTLVFALHLQLARLNSTIWWEWVESESNCSDGGSRVGICCPLAAQLGIELVVKPFPELPVDFMRLDPRGWEHFWKTNITL